VVIVIIAILASVIAVSLGGARKQARDSKRTADLKNTSRVLEEYYVDKGTYPTDANTPNGICLEADPDLVAKLRPYMGGGLPADPLYAQGSANHCYLYKTANNGQIFKIFVTLEDPNSSLAQNDGGTQNTPGPSSYV